MSTTVTNQTAAPANAGQCVLVTLNASDSAALATLVAGTKATCGSSSKVGQVINIDKLGNTFEVQPNTQQTRFDSTTTPYVLAAADTVVLG